MYRSTASATNNPDDPELPLEIRIVDLGSAVFENDWHQPLIGTNEYRAPEAILQVRSRVQASVKKYRKCVLISLIYSAGGVVVSS